MEAPSKYTDQERLLFVYGLLIGQIAEIRTLNGDVFEGIVHSIAAKEKKIVLKLVLPKPAKDSAKSPKSAETFGSKTRSVSEGTLKKATTPESSSAKSSTAFSSETYYPGDTLIVDIKNVHSLVAKRVHIDGTPSVNARADKKKAADAILAKNSQQLANASRRGFMTDTAISGQKRASALHGRELEAWVPPPDSVLPVMSSLETGRRGAKWDQFETNREKFGIVAHFDEELYTTPLDRNSADYKRREREAIKLARDIEMGGSSNLHVLEERNRVSAQGEDGSYANDDEAKYGAVIRDQESWRSDNWRSRKPSGVKPASAGPQNLSSLRQNAALNSSTTETKDTLGKGQTQAVAAVNQERPVARSQNQLPQKHADNRPRNQQRDQGGFQKHNLHQQKELPGFQKNNQKSFKHHSEVDENRRKDTIQPPALPIFNVDQQDPQTSMPKDKPEQEKNIQQTKLSSRDEYSQLARSKTPSIDESSREPNYATLVYNKVALCSPLPHMHSHYPPDQLRALYYSTRPPGSPFGDAHRRSYTPIEQPILFEAAVEKAKKYTEKLRSEDSLLLKPMEQQIAEMPVLYHFCDAPKAEPSATPENENSNTSGCLAAVPPVSVSAITSPIIASRMIYETKTLEAELEKLVASEKSKQMDRMKQAATAFREFSEQYDARPRIVKSHTTDLAPVPNSLREHYSAHLQYDDKLRIAPRSAVEPHFRAISREVSHNAKSSSGNEIMNAAGAGANANDASNPSGLAVSSAPNSNRARAESTISQTKSQRPQGAKSFDKAILAPIVPFISHQTGTRDSTQSVPLAQDSMASASSKATKKLTEPNTAPEPSKAVLKNPLQLNRDAPEFIPMSLRRPAPQSAPQWSGDVAVSKAVSNLPSKPRPDGQLNAVKVQADCPPAMVTINPEVGLWPRCIFRLRLPQQRPFDFANHVPPPIAPSQSLPPAIPKKPKAFPVFKPSSNAPKASVLTAFIKLSDSKQSASDLLANIKGPVDTLHMTSSEPASEVSGKWSTYNPELRSLDIVHHVYELPKSCVVPPSVGGASSMPPGVPFPPPYGPPVVHYPPWFPSQPHPDTIFGPDGSQYAPQYVNYYPQGQIPGPPPIGAMYPTMNPNPPVQHVPVFIPPNNNYVQMAPPPPPVYMTGHPHQYSNQSPPDRSRSPGQIDVNYQGPPPNRGYSSGHYNGRGRGGSFRGNNYRRTSNYGGYRPNLSAQNAHVQNVHEHAPANNIHGQNVPMHQNHAVSHFSAQENVQLPITNVTEQNVLDPNAPVQNASLHASIPEMPETIVPPPGAPINPLAKRDMSGPNAPTDQSHSNPSEEIASYPKRNQQSTLANQQGGFSHPPHGRYSGRQGNNQVHNQQTSINASTNTYNPHYQHRGGHSNYNNQTEHHPAGGYRGNRPHYNEHRGGRGNQQYFHNKNQQGSGYHYQSGNASSYNNVTQSSHEVSEMTVAVVNPEVGTTAAESPPEIASPQQPEILEPHRSPLPHQFFAHGYDHYSLVPQDTPQAELVSEVLPPQSQQAFCNNAECFPTIQHSQTANPLPHRNNSGSNSARHNNSHPRNLENKNSRYIAGSNYHQNREHDVSSGNQFKKEQYKKGGPQNRHKTHDNQLTVAEVHNMSLSAAQKPPSAPPGLDIAPEKLAANRKRAVHAYKN